MEVNGGSRGATKDGSSSRDQNGEVMEMAAGNGNNKMWQK